LLVGRDLHEAERVRRLLPAQVGVAQLPSAALPRLSEADVVLLEDRAWPAGEDDAVGELRERSLARTLALIVSRRRGEDGDPVPVPVVERPYRMEELLCAMRTALLRKKA
jgi:hypothetical protein